MQPSFLFCEGREMGRGDGIACTRIIDVIYFVSLLKTVLCIHLKLVPVPK